MNATVCVCQSLPPVQSASSLVAGYASAVISALVLVGQWFAKQGWVRRWWQRRKGHMTKSDANKQELERRLIEIHNEARVIKNTLQSFTDSMRSSQSSHGSCPPSPTRVTEDDAVPAAHPPWSATLEVPPAPPPNSLRSSWGSTCADLPHL